jgi:hypothetical protein
MSCLGLILMALATSSCVVTRKQIEAATWVNNFNAIPDDACYPGKSLYRVGFFRRLDTGKYQFVSVCSDTGNKMLSATADDYKKLLDAALKKDETKSVNGSETAPQ